MSFVERKKKQFIRWYYGEFVNDPQAETFTFGMYRPYGAMRLTDAIRFVKRNRLGLTVAGILLVGLLVFVTCSD